MSSPWLSTLLYASQSAAIGAACRCGGMPKASIMCWLLGASSAQRLLLHGHGHVQSFVAEISGERLAQAASKGLL